MSSIKSSSNYLSQAAACDGVQYSIGTQGGGAVPGTLPINWGDKLTVNLSKKLFFIQVHKSSCLLKWLEISLLNCYVENMVLKL